MKRYLIALAIVALLPLTVTAATKSTKTSRPKKPSPSLEKVEDVAGLPRVMLIGDSISMGYTVPVRELLKGVANVHRAPTNCGDTTKGLESLDSWLGTGKWDVIHFNWGLHDLKYFDANKKLATPDKGKQVNPLPVYEKNLRELVARMKKTGAKLIWCATTPVPDGCDGRIKGAEVEYNQVAAKIMKENGVAIDDLHAYAAAHLAEIQLPKNVHFHTDGSKKLAELVVTSIKAQLGK